MVKNPITVVIADRSPKLLDYYQTILGRTLDIYCVGRTTRADEIAPLVLHANPSVLLLDHAILWEVGFDHMVGIQHELQHHLPTILLGGRDLPMTELYSVGIVASLSVPITPKHLIEAIRRAIQIA